MEFKIFFILLQTNPKVWTSRALCQRSGFLDEIKNVASFGIRSFGRFRRSIQNYFIEKVEFPEECSKVIEYFEKNWMGIGRRKPSFSPDVWSCHLNVLNKLPRTNNSVEGWHKGFNELLAAHPIVWSFLDAIKNEQSKNELIYNQIISGSLQSYKLKKYKNIDDKIERLVCSYKKENLIAFLKGITCNFS